MKFSLICVGLSVFSMFCFYHVAGIVGILFTGFGIIIFMIANIKNKMDENGWW